MTEKEFNDSMADNKNEFEALKRSALEAKTQDELNKISKRRDELNVEKGRIMAYARRKSPTGRGTSLPLLPRRPITEQRNVVHCSAKPTLRLSWDSTISTNVLRSSLPRL